MTLHRAILLIPLLLTSPGTLAQEEKLTLAINNIITAVAEEGNAGNGELLTEMLLDLAAAPVQINRCEPYEMARLFFLTPFQVESLISYISRTGPVVSSAELASLYGFGRETVEVMMPFISLSITEPTKGKSGYSRVYHRTVFSTNFKLVDGVPEPLTQPSCNSMRYRMQSGRMTAQITAASDPGEKPVWSGNADFISGGIALKGNGLLNTIIIGDYSARFGMGLTLNSGYKPFLTLTGSSFMGNRDGFNLSASSNENNYLRGLAATAVFGGVRLSSFISSRYRDARLKSDTSGVITADILTTAPTHNSLSGMTATGVLHESSTGGSLQFGAGSYRGAITACYTAFSREVCEVGSAPDQIFGFNGTGSFNAGASYRMAKGIISGAGELSISGTGALATAHTLNIRLNDRLTANMIYRNYSRRYYGHLSAGPGRSSTTTNEEGLMSRITFEAARGLFIYGGADIYRFPWLKHNVSFPSRGFRGELRALYEARKIVTTEFRLSAGETWKNSTDSYGVRGIAISRNTTSRMIITANTGSALNFTINIMHKTTRDGTTGSLVAGDIIYSPATVPLSLWFRHAVFTTDSFASGLYLYENDMLYGFSVPVHWGDGSRTAIVTSLRMKKYAELKVKYGITLKKPATENPVTEDIKVQVKLNF